MKQFYLIVLALLLFNAVFAAPIIKAVNNGAWSTSSNWNLNRLPQPGDTIEIPFGKIITFSSDQNITGSVYVSIHGKLNFSNSNSVLSLGVNSIIKVYAAGQILGGGSALQKIRIGNSAVFIGTDAPVNGPMVASSLTNRFTSFASAQLPIKFVGFTVSRKNTDALIQWSTSEEMNVNMFEVQRSLDGTDWKTIAYVSAIGNSGALNNYSFNDKNITVKVVYYRIKETQVDGNFSYSNTSTFKNEISSTADVRIAAIDNKLLLQFPQAIKGQLVVRFVTTDGRIAHQTTISDPLGQVVMETSLTGHYIISISNGNEINTSKQVLL